MYRQYVCRSYMLPSLILYFTCLLPFQVLYCVMAEGPVNPVGSTLEKNSRGSVVEESDREPEPLTSVQHNITCGHCKNELTNPHLLCCMHSVCEECLPNLVVENAHLKCPQCGDTSTHWNDGKMSRSECRSDSVHCVPVPNGPLARYIEGVKVVQKVTKGVQIPCGNKRCKSIDSPSTVLCIECGIFMCERCNIGHEVFASYEDHTVKTLEEIRSLGPQECQLLFSKNIASNTCPQHDGEVLKYCCEQCNLLMCQACAIDLKLPHNPKHLSTKSTAFDHHTQSVRIAHQTAVCYESKYQKIEKEFQTQIRTVDEMKEAALHNINTAFQNIHQVVDERKEELCRQVIATAEEKKRTISSKITAAKREKEMSSNTQSSLQFLLTSGSSHDVIASKDLVQTQQSILTSKWCQEEFEHTVSQVVSFDPTNQAALLKTIREFGAVEDGACPVNCTVEPKSETLRDNRCNPVTLTLNAFDSKNIRCKSGGDNVESFLRPKSPIPGPAIKARVVDDENGQYTLSFPITYPGECDLSILVNGSDVRGSPFSVNNYRTLCPKLIRDVAGIKASKDCLQFPQQLTGVYGIATSPNGTIFVSDYRNHQIHVFNAQRKHIRTIGQPGSGQGQLNSPYGLAVDSDDLLYVANCNNRRIEVLREDGTFVRQIGVGVLNNPWNETINNKHVYVADAYNHRIAIFTLEGQLVRSIGSQGSGLGQFHCPSAVAFSLDEDIYVADFYNHRIQVFTAEGLYKREFGKGQLKEPRDLLITADGDVLVADQGNNCVAVFNSCGNANNFVHSFEVENPLGLTIDGNGDILVTDNSNKLVVIF